MYSTLTTLAIGSEIGSFTRISEVNSIKTNSEIRMKSTGSGRRGADIVLKDTRRLEEHWGRPLRAGRGSVDIAGALLE